MSRVPLLGSLLVVSAVVGGCGAAATTDLGEFRSAYQSQVAAAEYEVSPPDVLGIRAPGRPELDNELIGNTAAGQINVNIGSASQGATYRVRPDGKIMLPRLGEVHVAGMTPSEISRELTRRYREFFREVNVVVDVVGYQSKFIQVAGQVARTGKIPYTGRETLLQVLAEARPLNTAWGERIRITRGHPVPGKAAVIDVNLYEMVEDGVVKKNILLAEGDTVYVPPHPLAKVGMAVQTLLFPINPVLNTAQGAASLANINRAGGFGGGGGNAQDFMDQPTGNR
jgi:polysaccharide export outer membrane protein